MEEKKDKECCFRQKRCSFFVIIILKNIIITLKNIIIYDTMKIVKRWYENSKKGAKKSRLKMLEK